MAGRTISTTLTTEVSLTPATDNPLSITSLGAISVSAGVALFGQSIFWTIQNDGLIDGTDTSGGIGISLSAGGNVTSQGSIAGGRNGVDIGGGTGKVINDNKIAGGTGSGVVLRAGGAVGNATSAQITGGINGVVLYSGTATAFGTVTNLGSITSDNSSVGNGIDLFSGGVVHNGINALIQGATGIGFDDIATLAGAGTVLNAGTIIGRASAGYAVKLAPGFANRVIDDPGAVFTGIVSGGNSLGAAAASTLELGSNGSTGMLAGLGTQFVDFAQVTVDTGASWTLASSDTLGLGGTLTVAGTVSNSAHLRSGVTLGSNAVFTNASSGSLYYRIPGGGILPPAPGSALYDSAGPATVTNQGFIGGHLYGVDLRGGGAISNSGLGIYGYGTAALAGAGVTVVNHANILDAFGDGISLTGGGAVTNAPGGEIGGGLGGIFISGGATLVNQGNVYGNIYAVSLASGAANLLVDDPSAAFNGLVDGGNAIIADGGGGGIGGGGGATYVSTLELGSATTQGTLTGLGSQFIDFGAVTVDAGAYWTLSGANTVALDAVLTAGGTLDNTGSLRDAGSIRLADGGRLINAGTAVIVASDAAGLYGEDGSADVLNQGSITGAVFEAVDLTAGGTVSNSAGGVITAGHTGISISAAPGVVRNAGSIGGGTAAVIFAAGVPNLLVAYPGAVFSGKVNGGNGIGATAASTLELGSGASSGTLSSLGSQFYGFARVTIDTDAGWTLAAGDTLAAGAVLTDSGSVSNSAHLSGGVTLGGGGALDNAASGSISGPGAFGLYGGGFATVTNQGVINGGTAFGVDLHGGGMLSNASGGSIAAGSIAAVSGIGVTVINQAGITGSGLYGVQISGGGHVTNVSDGSIAGSHAGVLIAGGGTVINQGSIGGANAVLLAPGAANLLIDAPGAVFSGTVDGGNTIGATAASTLQLGTGASIGTLAGLGSQFLDFAQITVVADANWALAGGSLPAGATLIDSGTLTNTATLTAAGLLVDDGSLTNTDGIVGGVSLGSGADLTNAAAATIDNGYLLAAYGTGTVLNQGSINGGVLLDGGIVTNEAAGRITGYQYAIVIDNGAGTVVNDGRLSVGTYGIAALALNAGGSVTNASGATIASTGNYASGIYGLSVLTVLNQGRIVSSGADSYGLVLSGTVTNAGGGNISGSAYGIRLGNHPGTVINQGTISGGTDAVLFHKGWANLLVDAPGAVFAGTVDGGNSSGATAASVLQLGTGTGIGTFSGLGSQFLDFAQVTIVADAIWTMDGDGLPAAALTDSGTLANTGRIARGVSLGNGANLTNTAAGTIDNGTLAAAYGTGSAVVLNQGSINGGVALDGGSVTNAAAGRITGDRYAIVIDDGAGTIVNDGRLSVGGNGIAALALNAGGRVTNASGATIAGTGSLGSGVYGLGVLTVLNQGLISAGGAGLVLSGTVTNAGSGDISGSDYGIRLGNRPGTVINQGIISGGIDAVLFHKGWSNLLVDAPGAVFSGIVDGGSTIGGGAVSTLELAAGPGPGTLAGLGSQVIDFARISLDAAASWRLGGTVAAGQAVDFAGANATLALADPAGFAGTIDHFVTGDLLVLPGLTDVTAATLAAGNMLQIRAGASTLDLQLDPAQTFRSSDFLHANVSGGTEISVACFLRGTHIDTPAGPRAIETLAIGDPVRTGGGAARPVRWIGRRSYSAGDTVAHPHLRPVLIRPGALADGIPHRALRVSPMHALFIGGVFIPAAALVNGTSIRRDDTAGAIDYFHVELDIHAVIFAEGAPTESFVDENSRLIFDNAADHYRRYGDTTTPARAAPRLEDGFALEALRRRLGARTRAASLGRLRGHVERVENGIAEGWVLDEANPAIPVELEAWSGEHYLGRVLANRYRADLDRAGLAGGRCAFRLPAAGLAGLSVRRTADGADIPIS